MMKPQKISQNTIKLGIMKSYNTNARRGILDLLKNDDIAFVIVRTSKILSSIYNKKFWTRIVELLYNKERLTKITFRIPAAIDAKIFEKINEKIKSVAEPLGLGEYNKGKIDYYLDPKLNEKDTGVKIDGITIMTYSDIGLRFETTKAIIK